MAGEARVGLNDRTPAASNGFRKEASRARPGRTWKVRMTVRRSGRSTSTAARKRNATKAGAKPRTPAPARKTRKKPVLLAGGNPQITMADGDAPVQRYIEAMPGWKRDIGRRLDALIVRTVPSVHKAVKWNSPFYGLEDRGWILSFHVFTRYVKVTFFQGTSLRPAPAGGTGREARWVDVQKDGLDEKQMAAWIRQAAKLPGWGKV